jgi:hypothetical protein
VRIFYGANVDSRSCLDHVPEHFQRRLPPVNFARHPSQRSVRPETRSDGFGSITCKRCDNGGGGGGQGGHMPPPPLRVRHSPGTALLRQVVCEEVQAGLEGGGGGGTAPEMLRWMVAAGVTPAEASAAAWEGEVGRPTSTQPLCRTSSCAARRVSTILQTRNKGWEMEHLGNSRCYKLGDDIVRQRTARRLQLLRREVSQESARGQPGVSQPPPRQHKSFSPALAAQGLSPTPPPR